MKSRTFWLARTSRSLGMSSWKRACNPSDITRLTGNLIDLSKFQGSKLDNFTVVEDREFGYMISANLTASTLMIADKSSDMIRGKAAPEAVVVG